MFDSPHLKKNDAPGHVSRVDLVRRRVPLSQGAPPGQVAETDGVAAEVRRFGARTLLIISLLYFRSILIVSLLLKLKI